MDDGAGGMRCKNGNECQVSMKAGGEKRSAAVAWDSEAAIMNWWGGGGGGAAKKQKWGDSGGMNVVCSVHLKERSVNQLTDDGEGGMCCMPGKECQMGAGGGAVDNSQEFCSVHKKKRSAKALMDDGMGGKQCAPGQECQLGQSSGDPMATELVTCSIHGKNRSMQSMEDDFAGGYKCKAGFTCQVGGGKGGGKDMMANAAKGMNAAWMAMMQGGLAQSMKGKGKGKGKPWDCVWCAMGQCWDH